VIDPTESFGYLKCWQDMKSLVHALTHASNPSWYVTTNANLVL
jgi:hypothetical protein